MIKCNICGFRIWFWQKKSGLRGFFQYHKKCTNRVRQELKAFESQEVIYDEGTDEFKIDSIIEES